MKFFLFRIVTLASGALLLASCTNEEKNIRESAYNYALLTSNYQIDSAALFATEETKTTTLVMARNIMQAVGKEYIESDIPANIKILSVDATSDTDAYAVYHKTTPRKNFIDTLNLKKRDGVWLVHCPIQKVKRPTAPEYHDSSYNQNFKRLKNPIHSKSAKQNLK